MVIGRNVTGLSRPINLIPRGQLCFNASRGSIFSQRPVGMRGKVWRRTVYGEAKGTTVEAIPVETARVGRAGLKGEWHCFIIYLAVLVPDLNNPRVNCFSRGGHSTVHHALSCDRL